MVTNSNEYMRAYYSKNKDKYRTKYNPEHFCTVCNCTMKIKNRYRHVKTKKHLERPNTPWETIGLLINRYLDTNTSYRSRVRFSHVSFAHKSTVDHNTRNSTTDQLVSAAKNMQL